MGEEGRLGERASMVSVSGSWKDNVESINLLINSLATPATQVARVITAVAEGDLSKKMALDIEGRQIKGEFLRIGNTVNTMVDQLNLINLILVRYTSEETYEKFYREVQGLGSRFISLEVKIHAMS